MTPPAHDRTLVIGCGALGRELHQLIARDGLDGVVLRTLPPALHNRPERIPGAVEEIIRAEAGRFARIFVAYADCGTGGALDRVLGRYGIERLPGAHCYEVFAGREDFTRLAEEEPGTFYLTDFLVRAFDRLVISGLGLDRHPELLTQYFGGYRRVVYLAQRDDPGLRDAAARAAARLGLTLEVRVCGLGALEPAMHGLAQAPARGDAPTGDPPPYQLEAP